MFKWGYAENVPLEIEYGDPDGSGRDLKTYNEILLLSDGVLDTDAFARVEVQA